MRNIFSIVPMITLFLVSMVLMPMPVSAQKLDIGELIGRGLGAYGAAKLCGKGPATAVGCGVIGAQIGGTILSFQSHRGGQPQQYQQQQYAAPIMSCQTIALQMPNGQPAVGTACMTPTGHWQIVNVQAY